MLFFAFLFIWLFRLATLHDLFENKRLTILELMWSPLISVSHSFSPPLPCQQCQPDIAWSSQVLPVTPRERSNPTSLSMTLRPSRAGLCLTLQPTGHSFVLAASAYRQQPEHKMLSNLLQAPATLNIFSLLCSSLA